ncbi:MAG: DUF4202 family protein [Polyangiaceae bacterium]|nr:DUF4202 family protein [Polyangiaceae bacterium]
MPHTTWLDGSAGHENQAGEGAEPVARDLPASTDGRAGAHRNAPRCGEWVDAAECWDETRWRRNEASRSELFEMALAAHASMHTSPLPWVRVDRAHALDTWQRLLVLCPDAGVEVQIAALFHDINRLIDEAEERLEHRASNYQAFKDDHAQRSAELAYEALEMAGLPKQLTRRVAALAARHEGRPEGLEESALADADALSFLSLLGPGYADAFGIDQARRKVRHTLKRLGAQSRPGLVKARLRQDVRWLVDQSIPTLSTEAV